MCLNVSCLVGLETGGNSESQGNTCDGHLTLNTINIAQNINFGPNSFSLFTLAVFTLEDEEIIWTDKSSAGLVD